MFIGVYLIQTIMKSQKVISKTYLKLHEIREVLHQIVSKVLPSMVTFKYRLKMAFIFRVRENCY